MTAVMVTAVAEATTPVATPLVPAAFETVAIVASLDDQVTSAVMFLVLALSKVPVAWKG
jgi:hypothetical protein